MSEQRLTWEQVREKYPNQWVALTNVEYWHGNKSKIISAVVVCGMSDDKYTDQRLQFMTEGKDYVYERTTNAGAFVGVTL